MSKVNVYFYIKLLGFGVFSYKATLWHLKADMACVRKREFVMSLQRIKVSKDFQSHSKY